LSVYDALGAALADAGIAAEEHPGEGYLSFPLDGWLGVAQAWEEHGQASVFAIWPEPVPRDRMAEAAIALAKLSFDLRLGAFVLDPDGGEIRFRASIDFADREPDPALVRPLLMVAAGMAAHHEDLIRGLAPG
jgi:hypothetical protein